MPRQRDLRDPNKLGDFLARIRERAGRKKVKLSTLYDQNHAEALAVEPYTGEGGIAAEQQAKWLEEHPEGLSTNDDPGGS